MKLYCKVENNSVVQSPRLLDIQNYYKSDFELLDDGWYTVEQILPETFDERFEVMNTIQYEILQYKVIANYTKRNKTTEELQQYIDSCTLELQFQQQNALTICESVLDPDGEVFSQLSPQEVEHWRDFKTSVENLFITNANTNVWEIQFPNIPMINPPLDAPAPIILP